MQFGTVEYPDTHFLNAANGWLELGLPAEAAAELEQIGFRARFHPDVLMARWKAYSRAGNWGRSLDVARALAKIAPDRPDAWICLGHSLCNLGRQMEAFGELSTASQRFPDTSAIAYFLAKLCRQLGNAPAADRWHSRWQELTDTAKKTSAPAEEASPAPAAKAAPSISPAIEAPALAVRAA